jgi:hypothetical protein
MVLEIDIVHEWLRRMKASGCLREGSRKRGLCPNIVQEGGH